MAIRSISPSLMTSWDICGYKTYLSYIEGKRYGGSPSMHSGTAFHKVISTNLETRKLTGKNATARSLFFAANETWNYKLTKDGVFIPPDQAHLTDKIIADNQSILMGLTDYYIGFIHHYAETPAIMIEQELTMDVGLTLFGRPILLKGIIDSYRENGICIDEKTKNQAMQQFHADKEYQPIFYYELIKHHTGKYPRAFQFRNWVKKYRTENKVKYFAPELVPINTERREEDFDKLLLKINCMIDSIENGIFPPADNQTRLCSPTYCEYWNECIYVPEYKRVPLSIH